jgi:hypothetical protein
MFEAFCTLMKSLTAVLDWCLGLICSLNSRTSPADTSRFIAMLESTRAQHTACRAFHQRLRPDFIKSLKTPPFLLIQLSSNLFFVTFPNTSIQKVD